MTAQSLNNLTPILLLALFALILYVTYQITLYRQDKIKKDALRMEIEAEERGYEIIEEATQEAHEMLTEAELESIRLTARERLQSKELLKSYEHKLNTLLAEMTQNLNRKGEAAEKELTLFRNHLEELSENKVETTSQALLEKLDEYFNQTRTTMQEFTNQLQNGTSDTLKTELDRIRAEVDHYKQTQIKALDEKIVAVVNKVLSTTTHQCLSTEEHADLIREALQKAKEEHAL